MRLSIAMEITLFCCCAMYESALLILQLLKLKMTGYATPPTTSNSHTQRSLICNAEQIFGKILYDYTMIIILGKHIDKLHCLIIMAHTH